MDLVSRSRRIEIEGIVGSVYSIRIVRFNRRFIGTRASSYRVNIEVLVKRILRSGSYLSVHDPRLS